MVAVTYYDYASISRHHRYIRSKFRHKSLYLCALLVFLFSDTFKSLYLFCGLMSPSKPWIIIPAYNEEKTLATVIEKCLTYSSQIVVVIDGCKDNTTTVARRYPVYVLEHLVNLGKGAALKTGCDFAVQRGAEQLIVIDADGQHDPQKIPLFLKALHQCDVVLGYRTFTRTMPFVFRWGNVFINYCIQLVYGMTLRDTQCGYRAFTAKAYQKIRWRASDYSMESEMIANMGNNHLSSAEVPIETVYLDSYKGTTLIDGIKIVFDLLFWRLTR